MPVPAAMVRGPLAMTGGGIAARSPVALTLLTGNAWERCAIAEVSVPQVGGTDSAPTLVARPIAADTAPPA